MMKIAKIIFTVFILISFYIIKSEIEEKSDLLDTSNGEIYSPSSVKIPTAAGYNLTYYSGYKFVKTKYGWKDILNTEYGDLARKNGNILPFVLAANTTLTEADSDIIDDTYVDFASADVNFGASTDDIIEGRNDNGYKRIYMRFNMTRIAELATNQTITNVTLYLWQWAILQGVGSDGTHNLTSHHLSNETWTEGTLAGTSCSAGADSDTCINWNNQPCGSANDHNLENSAQCNNSEMGIAEAQLNNNEKYVALEITEAFYDDFIWNNGEQNTSIVIKGNVTDNSGGRFRPKEYSTTGNRPLVEVQTSDVNTAPTIQSNNTIPETVSSGISILLNARINDTDNNINSANFTLRYPNGSIPGPTAENGSITTVFTAMSDLNWTSATTYILDDAGTYTAYMNISDGTDSIEGFFTFEITDTTAPTIFVDSPVNNSHNANSAIDTNVSISDNIRVEAWWLEILNGSTNGGNGELLQANTTPNICGDSTCGVNLSQFGYPLSGQMDLYIWSNDTNNTLAVERVNLSTGADTSDPVISITEPNSTFTSRTVNSNHTIEDNSDLDDCFFEVTNSAGGSLVGNTTVSDCANNLTVTFSLVDDVTNALFYIYANDTQGLNSTNSSTFSVDTSGSGGSGGVTGVSAGGGGGTGDSQQNITNITFLTLPENISELKLIQVPRLPGQNETYFIDRLFIPFSFATKENATFSMILKSNWEILIAQTVSGKFKTEINNTNVIVILEIKRDSFLTKTEKGALKLTDIYGRNIFVDPILIRTVNIWYNPIPFIPVPYGSLPSYALIFGGLGVWQRKNILLLLKSIWKWIISKVFRKR